jgi:hypothetical protein
MQSPAKTGSMAPSATRLRHVSPMAATAFPKSERLLWPALLVTAGAATLLFFWLLSQRLTYPHELEWMEGAMVDHAARIADGQPLYCAPGVEHVPFLYAPLLFWLGGLGMKLGLPGLLALRLIAAACSVGTALLLGHWVRKETQRVIPGLVACGLFLGGYGWLFWWYDLARNDGLFLLLTLGTAFQLRHGGRSRWLSAAMLATLAVLAKQSALMWLPAIGVGALLHDWRCGLRFAIAGSLGVIVAVGALHLGSDGWSTFYLFEMPRHHGIEGSRKIGFWTEDVLPMLPLLGLGLMGFIWRCQAGEHQSALYLAAVGSGGLLCSWLSRLHVGGFDNVMMYGFAGACLLGSIAAVQPAGMPRWRTLTAGMLLGGQFLLLGYLAWNRQPMRTALPSSQHAESHVDLHVYLQQVQGHVFLPGHGGMTRRHGKPASAHGQAVFDLLQALPRTPTGELELAAILDTPRLQQLPGKTGLALLAFRDDVMAALLQQRLGAIVLDAQLGPAFEQLFVFGVAGPDGQPGTPDDRYRRRAESLVKNGPALNPLIGFVVHSPYALEAVR